MRRHGAGHRNASGAPSGDRAWQSIAWAAAAKDPADAGQCFAEDSI